VCQRAFALILLLAAACRTAPLPGPAPGPALDAAAPADASMRPPDLSALVDAAPPDLVSSPDLTFIVGVVCGDVRCATEADQFCDSSDFGKSGTCRAHTSATNTPFACDGPEDCGQGGVCCLLPAGSACSGFGFCVTGSIKGEWMCHSQVDCGPGFFCCPVASGSPYQICLDKMCGT
jgi:hypothetical protein